MKTKLLRKVRKEFKIEYYPNGRHGSVFMKPCAIVRHKVYDVSYSILHLVTGRWTLTTFLGEQDAINEARSSIIGHLRSRYPKLGSYRKKFTKQQIWP